MCIAYPRKIVAIGDSAQMLVVVGQDAEASRETVSAALVIPQDGYVEQLVGTFVLIHAGFVISLLDEAEARSRLQVFAALRGGESVLDLSEFYAVTLEARELDSGS